MVGGSTYQDATATFDGHRRLKTKHIPQQDATAVTAYNYTTVERIIARLEFGENHQPV